MFAASISWTHCIIEIHDSPKGLSDFVLKNKDQFDLSECENKDLPLYHHLQEKKSQLSTEDYEKYINFGEPGKFKNETKWYSIEEFVALRPKQYSYVTENGKEAMRAKGISKLSTEKYLTHQMYVDQVLRDQEAISCKMSNIQSKNFQLSTQYIWKKALINYENKRYWLDSIYSLPFGHPLIKEIGKTITVEDVIDKIKGKDNYSYELNAYKLEYLRKQKEEELKKNKQNELSYISATNLNENHLEVLAEVCYNRNINEELKAVLSDPDGLLLLKDILDGN